MRKFLSEAFPRDWFSKQKNIFLEVVNSVTFHPGATMNILQPSGNRVVEFSKYIPSISPMVVTARALRRGPNALWAKRTNVCTVGAARATAAAGNECSVTAGTAIRPPDRCLLATKACFDCCRWCARCWTKAPTTMSFHRFRLYRCLIPFIPRNFLFSYNSSQYTSSTYV